MSDKKGGPAIVNKIVKYCIFCRLDITSLLHAHCMDPVCTNTLQMCLHCFQLGIAIEPHQVTHKYKLVDSTSIPVFSDEWGADEELLLLDAVEKCGLGNWSDISAYVGKKTEQQCEEHYFTTYIFSPFSPLPDITQPYPSGAKRMLDLTNNCNGAIDVSTLSFLPPNPNNPLGLPTVTEHHHVQSHAPSHKAKQGGPKKANQNTMEYERWHRCRLKQAHFEKPQETSRWKLQQMEFKAQQKNNLSNAVGYLPHRGDYEIEHCNDAEKDISEMDFRPDDSTIERELKLRVLEVYNHVLDERAERKQFIDRYQLLIKREKKLNREESQVYKALRPFARYLEPEEFDELVRSIVVERALRLRIEQLQTYRLNGIQTLADGCQFDAELAEMTRNWELMHKTKFLNTSTIPIGQHESFKTVLDGLDKVLYESSLNDKDDEQGSLAGAMDQSVNFFNADNGGPTGPNPTQPSRFVNGYPQLSTNPFGEPQQRQQQQQQQTKPTGINPFALDGSGSAVFSNATVAASDVPSFFQPSTSTPIASPGHTMQSAQVGVSPAQKKASACPCNTGGFTQCIFNLKDYPHAALLSTAEQHLCKELHLIPQHYLTIKEQLIKEAVMNGYITRGTARNVLKVDVHITDRVLNFCISQNILPPITGAL